MFEVLYDLPTPVVRLIFGIAYAALALIGLALARRFVLPRMRIKEDDAGFSGTMVQAVLIFYALMVTLIVVNVWQNYEDVSGIVSREATAIAIVYRDVTGYPEPTRSQAQTELREYVEYIIKEAWPQQQKGEVPRGGVELIDRLQATLFFFEPTTEAQKALHAETLHAFNSMIEARRLRLDSVVGGLPYLLWFAVIFGSVISLTSTFFFKVDDARLHGVLVFFLAVFVSLIVNMILAFDRPFRGDLGIEPDAYQLVYDQLIAKP